MSRDAIKKKLLDQIDQTKPHLTSMEDLVTGVSSKQSIELPIKFGPQPSRNSIGSVQIPSFPSFAQTPPAASPPALIHFKFAGSPQNHPTQQKMLPQQTHYRTLVPSASHNNLSHTQTPNPQQRQALHQPVQHMSQIRPHQPMNFVQNVASPSTKRQNIQFSHLQQFMSAAPRPMSMPSKPIPNIQINYTNNPNSPKNPFVSFGTLPPVNINSQSKIPATAVQSLSTNGNFSGTLMNSSEIPEIPKLLTNMCNNKNQITSLLSLQSTEKIETITKIQFEPPKVQTSVTQIKKQTLLRPSSRYEAQKILPQELPLYTAPKQPAKPASIDTKTVKIQQFDLYCSSHNTIEVHQTSKNNFFPLTHPDTLIKDLSPISSEIGAAQKTFTVTAEVSPQKSLETSGVLIMDSKSLQSIEQQPPVADQPVLISMENPFKKDLPDFIKNANRRLRPISNDSIKFQAKEVTSRLRDKNSEAVKSRGNNIVKSIFSSDEPQLIDTYKPTGLGINPFEKYSPIPSMLSNSKTIKYNPVPKKWETDNEHRIKKIAANNKLTKDFGSQNNIARKINKRNEPVVYPKAWENKAVETDLKVRDVNSMQQYFKSNYFRRQKPTTNDLLSNASSFAELSVTQALSPLDVSHMMKQEEWSGREKSRLWDLDLKEAKAERILRRYNSNPQFNLF